jgi:two-component system LytT family response regulator
MTFKVLIVDDERWCRDAIHLRVANNSSFDVVSEADNGEDALLLMRSLSPDIVFLDIEMPLLSGLEVAKESQSWFKGAIIFVTAYSHYALPAFEVNAFNYLVKPIDDNKFNDLLNKIQELCQLKQSAGLNLSQLKFLAPEGKSAAVEPKAQYLQRLSLKDGSNVCIVNVASIHYIESAGDYLGVTTENGTHIQRMTMKQLQTLLDPNHFIRCHRSHIVNRHFINAFTAQRDCSVITTLDGKEHQVSRRYLGAVKHFLAVQFD